MREQRYSEAELYELHDSCRSNEEDTIVFRQGLVKVPVTGPAPTAPRDHTGWAIVALVAGGLLLLLALVATGLVMAL
jgi:hypothetical protein